MQMKRDAALGLLILRLGAGLVFFLHGWQKLFGQDISFVKEMLTMAGWTLPDWLLWLVALVELVGGIALLTGFFARSAGFVLALEMLVAIILFHAREGFFIVAVPNVPLAFGFEYHAILIASLLCVGLGGPGRWALGDRGADHAGTEGSTQSS